MAMFFQYSSAVAPHISGRRVFSRPGDQVAECRASLLLQSTRAGATWKGWGR